MSKLKTIPDYRASDENDEYLEQLHQLTALTWDGDLISKTKTIVLIQEGKAVKISGGWNIITKDGVDFLHITNKIRP